MSIRPTNSTLLSRLRSGDDQEASWHEFDATYRELIRRYCLRCGLQTADAEDVQQIVMTSLMKALPGFRYSRDVGRFRDYLGRAVKNAVIKLRLRHQRKPQLLVGSDLEEQAASESDEDAWETEWMHDHFRRALRKARLAFQANSLRIFELLMAGESAAHIASSFGVTEAAVYKVKQRVRDHLKDLVAEQIREEEFDERAR